MPIKDYKKVAEVSEERFFSRDEVNATNKEYVRKFLDAYDVSPARLSIFFKHIPHLLEHTPDIKKNMLNSDKINKIFKELRGRLSPSYYATVVNISKRFVRWVNDGELPEGFKDVNGISKKEQKRKLNPNDMISWEDGLNLAKAISSMQIKAAILTQLDGGFRPSEFIDLNYGDIETKKDFIVANVKQGKTGARPVILFRCVPYLMRWLKLHPTRKADDPLWIMEFQKKGGKKGEYEIRKYQYPALSKRVRELAEKISLKKPIDFYNLRHSACVLAKKDNLPLEEAAKKFGHSVEFFTNTYGRLSTEDSIQRLSKAYGLKEDKEKRELNATCKCGFVNEPNSDICEQCGSPLSLKKAMEMDRGKDKEISDLKESISHINKVLEALNLEKNRK